MKKVIVTMVVLGLLPITSAPANAGVRECSYKRVYNKYSGTYSSGTYCSYTSYGKNGYKITWRR